MDLSVIPKFQYKEILVKDIRVTTAVEPNGHKRVRDVFLGDEQPTNPTERFWDSLCSKFGFGPSIFKYFSHAEVFERIHDTCPKDQTIRVTVQQKPEGGAGDLGDDRNQLLAISAENKSMLFDDQIKNILVKLSPDKVAYREGLIVSRHNLRRGIEFDIGPDKFGTNVTLETPVDGYGNPNLYLSLIRHVCTNGAVAYSKAFRSGIILGKGDSAPSSLLRAVESYSNEDGFVALKQRIASSQTSQASVFESRKLGKLLWKIKNDEFRTEFADRAQINLKKPDEGRNYLMTRLMERTGDLRAVYGVAQLDSISEKRMRALPSKCRVYDLLNFATEVATHHVNPVAARRLNGYFGDMIAAEYDLENSANQFGSFDDFIDPNSRAAQRVEVDRSGLN